MHSADYAVARCMSVCLSICLSHAGILSKRLHISSKFLPSGSPSILVFPHHTGWQYPDGDPLPLTGFDLWSTSRSNWNWTTRVKCHPRGQGLPASIDSSLHDLYRPTLCVAAAVASLMHGRRIRKLGDANNN